MIFHAAFHERSFTGGFRQAFVLCFTLLVCLSFTASNSIVHTLVSSRTPPQTLRQTPSLFVEQHARVVSVRERSFSVKVNISAPLPEAVAIHLLYSAANVIALASSNNTLLVPANRTRPLTFDLRVIGAGHCTVTAGANVTSRSLNVTQLYVRVSVLESFSWSIVSGIVGWAYFGAWTVSFYPQIYINYRRKSVVGLNFDFLALNLVGFSLYSLFNCCLYSSSLVQALYFQRHPHGLVPVAINDIVFALHALFACLLTAVQCCIYERGDQRISSAARILLSLFAAVIVVALVLTVARVADWLVFLYVLSYIKLTVTVVKYVPQAWQIYRRRSTEGWSIGNVLLDFSGGCLSVVQMFIDAYNYADWTSIFGNPTKFGLGVISMLFDILFIVQHYCLYRHSVAYESINDVAEQADEA